MNDHAVIKSRDNAFETDDELYEDENAPVDPAVMHATCVAHHQDPVPFDTEIAHYDDRLYEHCTCFEAVLAAAAPQIFAAKEQGGRLWSEHFNACRRLQSLLAQFPPQQPIDQLPPDLIYAVATTPYLRLATGQDRLCEATFNLKRRWFQEATKAGTAA
jgi:hypothetical protein